MRDLAGLIALAAGVAGLAVTAVAQVRPLRRRRALLDRLAVFPEWRFYAQASIHTVADLARDTHIVVRDRDGSGRVGGWQALLSSRPRRLSHAVWNPHLRAEDQILSIGEDLADVHARRPAPEVQQSIRYLTILRHAMTAPRGMAEATERQFAIVHTVGRSERSPAIAFLSGWHPW